jgi:hypothetical protein
MKAAPDCVEWSASKDVVGSIRGARYSGRRNLLLCVCVCPCVDVGVGVSVDVGVDMCVDARVNCENVLVRIYFDVRCKLLSALKVRILRALLPELCRITASLYFVFACIYVHIIHLFNSGGTVRLRTGMSHTLFPRNYLHSRQKTVRALILSSVACKTEWFKVLTDGCPPQSWDFWD